ncbi:MAG: glutaminyl-peptide cyclotransferase [Marinifilaceae bacterium]
MKKLYFFPIAFMTLLIACNGTSVNKKGGNLPGKESTKGEQINYVRSLRLKSPVRNTEYSEGEAVPIVVVPRRKAESIDSLQLIENGKVRQTLYKAPWEGRWIPQSNRMGSQNLTLLAYHSDGTIGRVSTRIKLKSGKEPQKYGFKIVNTYPHRKIYYTQGLFYRDGFLYEGTGQRGESTIRKMKLENGDVIVQSDLDSNYFGEGITWCNGKILQLTWTSGSAFVYNPDDFSRVDSFDPKTTNGQGWGITCAGKELFISDGSNVITVLDSKDYSSKRTIEVYDHKGKVKNLNELEYIQGKIYANVYLTDRIVIIDPETGRVTGDIDMRGLLTTDEYRRLVKGDEVLNGIAWDKEKDRLFVTGKRWPKLFEIKLEKK